MIKLKLLMLNHINKGYWGKMKLIFAIFITSLVSCFSSVSAQNAKIQTSIGANVGFVINESKSYRPGIGLSFQPLYRVSNNFGILLNSGYARFNNSFNNSRKIGFIPIQAGVRFIYNGVYLQGLGGIVINNGDLPKGLNLALGSRIGYVWDRKSGGIDFYASYNSVRGIVYTYGTIGASFIHYYTGKKKK